MRFARPGLGTPDGRRRVLGRARAFHRVSHLHARVRILGETLRKGAQPPRRRRWCSRACAWASPSPPRRSRTSPCASANRRWRRCATRSTPAARGRTSRATIDSEDASAPREGGVPRKGSARRPGAGSSPAIAEENVEHRGRPHRPRPRPVDGKLLCDDNARVDSGASRLVDLSPSDVPASLCDNNAKGFARRSHARCTS